VTNLKNYGENIYCLGLNWLYAGAAIVQVGMIKIKSKGSRKKPKKGEIMLS